MTSTEQKQTTTNIKDLIRTEVLDSKPTSELVPYGSQQIEIRTPSLTDLLAYRNANAGDGEVDPNLMAKMIVNNCYVPETNGTEKVFDNADIPVIMKLSYTKDMKRLVGALNKMLGDDEAVQKGVDEAKNA